MCFNKTLEAYSRIGVTYVMYAWCNYVMFRVENPLDDIAIRTYALETLLTWASNVRPESTITPRSRIDSAHSIVLLLKL